MNRDDGKNGQEFLTIGRLAAAADVPVSTLRYYEREGILEPALRSPSGYRLYPVEAVARLRFIRSAQSVGFTLDDIRVLLELDDGDPNVCRETVQGILQQRLAEVEAKMEELQRVRTALGRALDRCRRSRRQCAVLKDLRPQGERKR